MGDLDPRDRQPMRLEMLPGEVQVLLGQHPHADTFTAWVAGLEDQAVMAALLHPTEPDGLRGLIAHDEAEQIDVEGLARRNVPDAMDDVTGPGDGKSRFVHGRRDYDSHRDSFRD